MATVPSPPILVWQPGGGVPIGPISNPPVYSQAGTTQLVAGQSYIDVVFGSVQTTEDWVLVECVVVNETDVDPLNIWPGIITDKATSGFRLQLNGMPDSNNYYLHWAVSGVNIAPTPATTYYLTGPSSGPISAPTTFTVALPPSTTLAAPVVVTPSEVVVVGTPGTFTPAFVTLTTGSPSQTFTYTPASYGARTISTINSGPLTNPAGIVFSPLAVTYTLSGPTGGLPSVASTNFTVALPVGGVVVGTVTVTPSAGDGTFTPSTVALTTGAPSATFTYTPASVGAKTVSTTNNGGLTNPGSLTYTAAVPFSPTDIAGCYLWLKADGITGFADGAAMTGAGWVDYSGNHNDCVGYFGYPIYKTNIVNGLPAVRFSGSSQAFQVGGAGFSVTGNYTIFGVVKAAATGSDTCFFGSGTGSGSVFLRIAAGGFFEHYHMDSGLVHASDPGAVSAGNWFVIAGDWNGSNIHLWRDGTLKATTGTTIFGSTAGNILIGSNSLSMWWNGDIAEIIVYNSSLSATDRVNVEQYLGDKYGITIVPTLLRLEEIRERAQPEQRPETP